MRNLSIVLPALALLIIGAAAYIIVAKITTPPTILVSAKPQPTISQSSHNAQTSPSASIKTAVTLPSSDTVKQWQQEADAGKANWRLDPTTAAKELSGDYGFSTADQFSASTSGQDQSIAVTAKHGSKIYIFSMYQPAQTGTKGVWAIKSITEQ